MDPSRPVASREALGLQGCGEALSADGVTVAIRTPANINTIPIPLARWRAFMKSSVGGWRRWAPCSQLGHVAKTMKGH
jgi:hypothetical protein